MLTVSEASKRDILRFCRLPAEKVTVIYNAIDDRFREPPPAEEIERIRERFQLHEPFVLYVGNVKPHKNLERLIQAIHHLHENGYDALKLLVIGSDISKYAELRRAIHTYNLHRYVRFLGFVPDQTLHALYRLASVFAFPSLYEGFGLPPLEAMACGAPVVTSNTSSLPEVVGDAAILVDPTDSRAIAKAWRTSRRPRLLASAALAWDTRRPSRGRVGPRRVPRYLPLLFREPVARGDCRLRCARKAAVCGSRWPRRLPGSRGEKVLRRFLHALPMRISSRWFHSPGVSARRVPPLPRRSPQMPRPRCTEALPARCSRAFEATT